MQLLPKSFTSFFFFFSFLEGRGYKIFSAPLIFSYVYFRKQVRRFFVSCCCVLYYLNPVFICWYAVREMTSRKNPPFLSGTCDLLHGGSVLFLSFSVPFFRLFFEGHSRVRTWLACSGGRGKRKKSRAEALVIGKCNQPRLPCASPTNHCRFFCAHEKKVFAVTVTIDKEEVVVHRRGGDAKKTSKFWIEEKTEENCTEIRGIVFDVVAPFVCDKHRNSGKCIFSPPKKIVFEKFPCGLSSSSRQTSPRGWFRCHSNSLLPFLPGLHFRLSFCEKSKAILEKCADCTKRGDGPKKSKLPSSIKKKKISTYLHEAGSFLREALHRSTPFWHRNYIDL